MICGKSWRIMNKFRVCFFYSVLEVVFESNIIVGKIRSWVKFLFREYSKGDFIFRRGGWNFGVDKS